MATYYINPSHTFDGNGDGTADQVGAGGAYNTWASVTLASGNNYYQACDTEELIPARLLANGLSNITYGAYYGAGVIGVQGARPILSTYITLTNTGDFTEVATNIWEYEAGTEYYNPFILMGLGSIGDKDAPSWTDRISYFGGGNEILAFDTPGQWENLSGAANKSIVSVTEGATTTIVVTGHNINSGEGVSIRNTTRSAGTQDINGNHIATVTDPNTFTIPFDTSASTYDDGVGELSLSSKLLIYNTENPVTTWGNIYCLRETYSIFYCLNATSNIHIENMHAKNSSSLFKMVSNGNTMDNISIDNCISEHCSVGINFKLTSGSLTNSIVENCEIYNSSNIGIGLGGACPNLKVRNCKLYDTDGSEVIGAIYGSVQGTIGSPVVIENNYVNTVSISPYWSSECNALYTEIYSTYTTFRNNYVIGSERGALHSNSGNHGVIFHNNLVIDSNSGVTSSESGATPDDLSGVTAYNNTFINVPVGASINRPSGRSACDAHLHNNIFISDGTAGSIAVKITAEVDTISDSTFYNNCYIGFDYSFFQNDLVTPIANGVGVNIELDPLLDNNYAPQGDSPCIGAGIQPLSLTDYNGDTRKSLAGFDIGAVWFDGPMDTTVERLLASGGTK